MDVIGGNKGDTKPASQVSYFRQDFFLLGKAVILNFKVEIFFAENLKVLPGGCLGFIIHVFNQKIIDLALEATGKSNQSGGMFTQNVLINSWAVIKAFQISTGNKLTEMAITLFILDQKNQMIISTLIAITGFFLQSGFGSNINFAAQDWF